MGWAYNPDHAGLDVVPQTIKYINPPDSTGAKQCIVGHHSLPHPRPTSKLYFSISSTLCIGSYNPDQWWVNASNHIDGNYHP